MESGKDKQALNYLRSPDGFCCLGLGCDLYNSDEWKSKWQKLTPFLDGSVGWEFLGEKQQLPKEVVAWLGLLNPIGKLANPFAPLGYKTLRSLSELNDSCWSFKKIAAYIRANPDNVFEGNA